MCNGKILINHSSHTIALKFPSKDSPENVHQHTAIQIESNPAEERTDCAAFEQSYSNGKFSG